MPPKLTRRTGREERPRAPRHDGVPPESTDPPWARPAADAVVVLAVLALATVAFGWHPIGDHFTESDFYAYAEGGRGIARGQLDFARYGVIGPCYELLMAVPALLGVRAFEFAKAVSVASAAIVLLAWRGIVQRHAGELSALIAVTLLSANPVFFRYAYSTTTDAPAVALQAASLWALLAWRHRWAPALSGAAAALAVLTRYNSAFLLPGALLAPWLQAGRPAAERRGAIVAWLAAFAAIVLPWTVASGLNGHWPGEALFANTAFFAGESAAARNVQDLGPVADDASAPGTGLAARVVTNVPAHLLEDARQLLGLPGAILVVLGGVVVLASRDRRAWLPLAANVALAFFSLVPVFYSDRYSLAVLPGYLAFAAATARLPRWASWAGRARAWIPLALVAWPLVASVRENLRTQRFVHSQLPRDVLAAVPALRAERRPGDAVVSRKGALAHWAGVGRVAFPRVGTLAELAAHARGNDARFLYYSWYEGMLRPEFWYLLDSTASVPGLEPLANIAEPAAMLYRLGSEFGREPAWMSDRGRLAVHVARGQVRALADGDCWEAHLVLAIEARRGHDWPGVLAHGEAMTRGRPADTRGWTVVGDARVALGDLDGARRAYERAAAIQPTSAGARIGMGRIHLARGDRERAAEAWRPVIEAAGDSATLDAMRSVLAPGDTAALSRLQRAYVALSRRPAR